MIKYMDYMISSQPIRLFNPVVDASKRKIPSLALVNAGHLPGRTLRREAASFRYWAFVMIADGSGDYRVGDGEKQEVTAGSWFCLYPGETFHYGPHKGGTWDEYYFTVEGERIEEWLNSWLQQPALVKKAEVDDAIVSRMELMFMLIDSGIPSNLDRSALLLESLLYELMSQTDQVEAGNRGRFALKVIEDISNSIFTNPPPEEIAARHHISVSTLRRIVHEYTGYPLNEFLHRLKAAEAKRILLNTELSVKEIGETLGYTDTFYFSRVFKRITGVSPRNYRNRGEQ
ncbi:helix-turn-helix domain-containing protein [Paenibacillus sanguinis]|uniref:helix-turn-helix domain-containing protein n=1 Tax=Paenibacillus sanguinis TaxID=225906 RepID=UPI0003A70493|nr:AraC family transcriptional regulator [Paenibacillus sanguinis]